MRLLVSGGTKTVKRLESTPEGARYLGRLLTPHNGNSITSCEASPLPWACDNAAFGQWEPAAFCRMLSRLAGKRPSWVACPDVVGQARATLERFEVWQPVMSEIGVPVALVGQNGAEDLDLPWSRFQCLFIGGDTQWKLSQAAASLVQEALSRDKQVHMGRVNTRKRLEHAWLLGCHTVDGSGFSRWPDTRIPLAVRWLEEIETENREPEIFTTIAGTRWSLSWPERQERRVSADATATGTA